jgi:hypothetical protein
MGYIGTNKKAGRDGVISLDRHYDEMYSDQLKIVPHDNLIVWMKADDLEDSHNDGDTVATWSNVVDNTLDFAQSTTSRKPLYKTNQINEKPALEFDGYDDRLESEQDIDIEEGTIFYVMKMDNLDNDRTYILSFSDTSSYHYWSQYYTSGGDQGKFLWRPAGSDYAKMYNSNDLRGSWYIGELSWRLDAFSHSFEFFLNGDWFKKDYVSDNTPDSFGEWRIGINRWGSVGYGLDGFVSEFLVYDTNLSSSLREKVREYLSDKYNITLYGGITYA